METYVAILLFACLYEIGGFKLVFKGYFVLQSGVHWCSQLG